ncbi:MAG TPA: hypothetical protein VK661_08555 [Planctomycetota bacterium]|nr:hypothetical protein [Planctomycetota bacterium]
MKPYTGWLAFAALFGVVAGFGAGRFERTAEAQSVDNKTTRWLASSVSMGGGQDAFVLFDSQTNRLIFYTITGNKKLEVLAVREVSFDVRMVTWGKQEPTVQEIKDAWEKSERERADREKEKDKGQDHK